MNDVVECRDIAVQKNIKDELILFELSDENCLHLLKPKYRYFLTRQNQILKEHGVNFLDIITVLQLIKVKRYQPKVKERYMGKYVKAKYQEYDLRLQGYKTRINYMGLSEFFRWAKATIPKVERYKNRNMPNHIKDFTYEDIKLIILTYNIKESVIPYLAHTRGDDDKYVKALSDLNSRTNGMEFDEYISDWAKRLLYGQER